LQIQFLVICVKIIHSTSASRRVRLSRDAWPNSAWKFPLYPSGNLVYILTITSPSRNPEISREKRAVVLSARVHPGETNSSWMMKGFLDYLTGSSADAKVRFCFLRDAS